MADEIRIEGMRFYGYHGVNPEEQVLGQRFVVDLVITAELAEAGRSDDLTKTISYSDAFRRVRAIVEERRFDLLEALGEAICADILVAFPLADAVGVTVRKPGVAIKGAILEAAAVTIRRARR